MAAAAAAEGPRNTTGTGGPGPGPPRTTATTTAAAAEEEEEVVGVVGSGAEGVASATGGRVASGGHTPGRRPCRRRGRARSSTSKSGGRKRVGREGIFS